MTEVWRRADAAGVFGAAADLFEEISTDAARSRGRCAVALAGGSTPKGLYSLLAEERDTRRVPWQDIDVFWGDERHVPPDHPESNYRMAHETLLQKVPVVTGRVHRIHSEMGDVTAAARAYDAEVREALAARDDVPTLDLILLGLGSDAHTASLFPGTTALEEQERFVVANRVDALSTWRITMTFPIINAARVVIFVVVGRDKAQAVRSVLQPEPGRPPFPAQRVQPIAGRVVWLLDDAAAALLDERP